MFHKCSFFFTRLLRQVNISIFILEMKDRKQEHFKDPLFWDTSLETQRPCLKDLLCAAVMISFEAGCAFFPHSPSRVAQASAAEAKGWHKLRHNASPCKAILSHRLPQSHLPSVPSHMFPSSRASAGTCLAPSVS